MAWNQRTLSVPQRTHPRIGFLLCKFKSKLRVESYINKIIHLILMLNCMQTWLRVSQKLHTTSQVVVGAIFGSVYSTLWYITWNSLVLEAFASSFSVQVAVFAISAASALGFAVYVLLNWFKDDK